MTRLNTDRPELLKKRLTHAAQQLMLVGSSDQTAKYVAAIFLLKIIEDLWAEKHDQLQSLIDSGDEVALDALPERVNAEYLNIPRGSSFADIARRADYPDIAQIIDDALASLEKANTHILADVFEGARFSDLNEGIKHAPVFFTEFIRAFGHPIFDLRPSVIGSEALLALYEWICSEVDGAAPTTKAGELPSELGLLLAELLQPRNGDEIYDPVCGSGGFLMASGRLIRASSTESAHYTLYGQDVQSAKLARARINALIVGEEHLEVRAGDFFRVPAFVDGEGALRKFDVVAAQSALTVDGFGDLVVSDDPFHRFSRGVPPKAKGEYVLISHTIESLKEGTGRAAAIFTQGVLFREGAEAVIRERLVEENLIDAIIALPTKLVTGIPHPTVVVVFQKSRADNCILFIDASNEFEAGKSQNRLPPSVVEKIATMYKSRNSLPLISRSADLSEVRANNYNLQMNRYIDTDKSPSTHGSLAGISTREYSANIAPDGRDVVIERQNLESQLSQISRKIDMLMRKIEE